MPDKRNFYENLAATIMIVLCVSLAIWSWLHVPGAFTWPK